MPVVPRDDGLVVVGADPDHQLVLPDTAAVEQALVQLRQGLPRHLAHGPGTAVIDELERVGLLVDVDDQELLAAARATTRVRVDAPPKWRGQAMALLELAGLAVATRGEGDLTWALSSGAPQWATHDDLMSHDNPVLFTSVLPSRIRLGPFVLPGTTACLRCLDAQGPGPRPASETNSSEALPTDLSPLLLHRALGAAVFDLCAWAEGRQPATWSATVWMADQFDVTRQAWRQHPHCGCCWNHAMTG